MLRADQNFQPHQKKEKGSYPIGKSHITLSTFGHTPCVVDLLLLLFGFSLLRLLAPLGNK